MAFVLFVGFVVVVVVGVGGDGDSGGGGGGGGGGGIFLSFFPLVFVMSHLLLVW